MMGLWSKIEKENKDLLEEWIIIHCRKGNFRKEKFLLITKAQKTKRPKSTNFFFSEECRVQFLQILDPREVKMRLKSKTHFSSCSSVTETTAYSSGFFKHKIISRDEENPLHQCRWWGGEGGFRSCFKNASLRFFHLIYMCKGSEEEDERITSVLAQGKKKK